MNSRDIYAMQLVYAERDRQRALGHLDAHDYADGTGRHLDAAVPLPSPGLAAQARLSPIKSLKDEFCIERQRANKAACKGTRWE